MQTSWVDVFIKKMKESPDPLSTFISLAGSYIFYKGLTLTEMINYVTLMTLDDWFKLGLALVMALFGNRAFKNRQKEDIAPSVEVNLPESLDEVHELNESI